jgi:hypothetical protein
MIDFFYTGTVKIEADNLGGLVSLYALANFYGVDSLNSLLRDYLECKLTELADSKRDRVTIFQLTSVYRSFKVNDLPPEARELRERALESLVVSQDLFAPKLRANLVIIEKEDRELLFNSITPHLFAEVLQGSPDFRGTKLARLIEEYVTSQGNPSQRDIERLNSILSWDEPDAYLLFSEFRMDWVPPSSSRSLISHLIDQRRSTLVHFEKEVDEIREENISRWYVVSWIQAIRGSTGCTSQPEVELVSFLATLGGSCLPQIPCDWRFIDADCSPYLGHVMASLTGDSASTFGPRNIFDIREVKGKRHLYCSEVGLPETFIGLRCPGFVFDANTVVYEFTSSSPAHEKPKEAMRLVLSGWRGSEGKSLLNSSSSENAAWKGSMLMFELGNTVSFTRLKIENVLPDKLKCCTVLRATGLRVWGTFSAAVA